MSFSRKTVIETLADIIRERFAVEAERDRVFHWPEGSVQADAYLPEPLHCLVQFDDETHCTRERARTFSTYPADMALNFDVGRYLAGQNPGSLDLAHADALADLLPARHGFNPTVRIRADEIAEQPGTLRERLECLLSRRFSVHVSTAFQAMIEAAGAKPHRTQSR